METIKSKDFSDLQEFILEMNASNSTNHKVEVLKKYSDSEFIKKILQYTYHPYKQYGVTSANLKKRSDLLCPSDVYDNIFYLLEDLDARLITGHAALSATNSFIKKYEEFAEIIYQIIDRNLETRATTTLINRVFPDLIPTFDVALAHDITKVKKIDLIDGTWYLSRKLDGVRCIAIIKELGNIRFYSRNGKEFHTLGAIKDELVRLGVTNIVLDGEICMMKEDGSDDFQGILKQIQKKDHTIINPKFWVFDVLTTSEFEKCEGTLELSTRILRLGQIINSSGKFSEFIESKKINVLPQQLIKIEEDLLKLKEDVKEKGWEGLIARRNVGYEGTRTKNMLKLKEFHDAEYVVKEVIMGPQRVIVGEVEVTEDMLSAIIIEHKGNPVQVGSGFNMSERREYFKNPEKILNQSITVQYFEETVDQNGKNSLRFPVFKWNHGKTRST